MASFHLTRRGIVDLSDTSPACSTALRTNISISFHEAAATTLDLKLEAPVFLFNDEAKASLTRAERINNTFVSSRPRIRLAVFLHIPPQSITLLTFARQSSIPDHLAPLYQRLTRQPTISLHFKLSAPPILVIPKLPGPLIPSDRSDLDILQVFQHIASAHSTASGSAFTLYLPGTSLTDEQASSLCTSVPNTFAGLPRESPGLQLDTLFGGLGARQVSSVELATFIDQVTPTGSPNSPPHYESSEHSGDCALPPYKPEVQEAIPAGPEASHSRKRSRLSSPLNVAADTNAESSVHLGTHPVHNLLQSLSHQVTAAHDAIARLESLRKDLTIREAACQEREAACLEREAELDAQLATADEKLAELAEASAEDYSAVDLKEQLKTELVDILDDRFEVLMTDVVERFELEEMVEIKVGEAMEGLKERLANVLLSE
ncbi:unnamed protein product [Discula destructiva]